MEIGLVAYEVSTAKTAHTSQETETHFLGATPSQKPALAPTQHPAALFLKAVLPGN